MERQIAQMAEDQRKRDSGKLSSTTEIKPNHTQRAGKEHVNAVDAEWRKVTMKDLLGYESGIEGPDREKEVKNESESKVDVEVKKEEKEMTIEKEPQPKKDKDAQEEKQPIIAGIKQKKKGKKEKKKQEVPNKSTGPSMNQPLWDELKNAPGDTRIL
ncbi:hypothetical protein L2E82_22986 [Cichorium intybus]|uniref:Uncharacterized protein n=1 Tax=Cichorium intybus TaxID=13427 RepID=A0ACB9DZ26_CICIN|nr:hypothetical protein L2E82_22986 [Cichorium intybus]